MNELNPPRSWEAIPVRAPFFVQRSIRNWVRAGRASAAQRSRLSQASWKCARTSAALSERNRRLFALVDSLAKVFLTCVSEPRGTALEPALAEARNRHARLLNTAGHAMLSDSLIAMEDLMSRGEK